MRPRLVRKVKVDIQPIESSQVVDPDFNQIIGGATYKTDVDGNPVVTTIKGQPKFESKDEAGMSQFGARRGSRGYILLEEKEAEKITKFDRILAINGHDLEAEVIIYEKEPGSFSGSSSLIKCQFMDKSDFDG